LAPTPRNIDLVLTDVVMPEGMSGMDLAQKLLPEPSLKIIFASGYSMDELDTDFIRQGNALFLQKPYTHITLAKAVRDCLDMGNGYGGVGSALHFFRVCVGEKSADSPRARRH